ncbi:MAG: DUF1570 domain-containing protein [Planctomycetes bacterium]|nr:DUF1570 domain-containing protein [Planctomycetota bacterium]
MGSHANLLVLLGLPFAAQAPAPQGYRTFESRVKGITLHIPARYEELPVPPDEEWIQLRFTEKRVPGKEKPFRSEIWIVRAEKAAPPQSQPESRAAAESRPMVRSIEDYVNKVALRKWTLKSDGALDLKERGEIPRHRLAREDGELRGLGYVFEQEDSVLFLLGLASREDFAAASKIFEQSARSFRVREAADPTAEDVDLYYRYHPFRNVEYRKEVRRNLSRGWKAEDTENYILIHDTKDAALLRKIKSDLEIIRTKYLELFPPVKEIEAVSTVRVCKDKEEFQKFSGAPPNVGGFWNSETRELVFYDAEDTPEAPGSGRKDSIVVLYHEAFHQYIYYSCGEVAPHSWYNEGTGDYFSGARIPAGYKRVERIGPNPWRVGLAKRIVEEKSFVPLKEFVRFEQPKYYAKPHHNYAQGWAFVFFLRESKVVAKHPAWSRILPVYFETLKAKYAEAIAAAGENPPRPKVEAAEAAARNEAVEAAFSGVSFEDLEKAWVEFVGALKDPAGK